MAELWLDNGRLRARILTRGATLAGLWLGGGPNLVLGFRAAADFAAVPIYAGCIVGPVANRVARGRVVIDGTPCQMPLNEDGRNTLHSGPEGSHARDWQVGAQAPDRVSLDLTLADGDCGLPGLRQIRADYALSDGTLTLTLRATSDAATALNLAHHPYWHLGPAQRLQVMAGRVLPVDDALLPTGEVADVAGTPFDLRAGGAVPGWLDHCYVLAEAVRADPVPAARLIGDAGRLTIATTAPGLQVYAGGGLPRIAANRCDGTQISPHAGIAIEPQGWPDSSNWPHFPPILLRPGQEYRQVTQYCFADEINDASF